MADPEVRIETQEHQSEVLDVTMGGAGIETPAEDIGDVEVADVHENGENSLVKEGASEEPLPKLTFIESPIVELEIGTGDDTTLLTAHEALLTQSPYFAEQIAQFSGDEAPRRLILPDEDLDAIGCFLQYQYTGEYFPKRLEDSKDIGQLELDPSIPAVDDTGAQLLKHARIYTLATKLEIPALKALAHSKIHRVNSTAKGEIEYARYVYGHIPKDDTTIRKPVAMFWATRSHVLRHEAEEEFRSMCLEYPEFGFDVLSLVLDHKEKRSEHKREEETTRSSRKRARLSER
ncbi:MAG: hypothetical protein M1834_000697 [Cirrosporium novae-zelandiae]|nr:MAG: hypothetical protein M1834_000697 [Cirrosporium novae-zelandiae]